MSHPALAGGFFSGLGAIVGGFVGVVAGAAIASQMDEDSHPEGRSTVMALAGAVGAVVGAGTAGAISTSIAVHAAQQAQLQPQPAQGG